MPRGKRNARSSMKLHSDLETVEKDLAAAEDQWLAIQEEAVD